MQKTIRELAKLVDGEIIGNDSAVVTGVCGIQEAQEGDVTFLANAKYFPFLETTRATAVVTSRQVTSRAKTLIRTDNPSLAFARIVSLAFPADTQHPRGVDQTASIGKNVALGKNVAIGAHAVIADNVSIGDGSVMYPNCYVGHNTVIGSNALIYPNVSIREHIVIGNNVIIHSGTVIGSDGFGYATIDGVHHKIPQIGTVIVGDDVEIGANVTIDRARFDKTVIGKGTKIDNLVQIAHNVVIGENSIIVAQVGISGSTVVGNNVTIAGQAGLVGHITIGDGAIIAAQAGVSKSVPADTMVWGYPAKPMETAKRLNACVHNLPRLYKAVEELKKKIQELESHLQAKK
ncbi:MAG TPA: UDP-3-O-(3-hydroxymyristoyl)glucosamine N-acyltransferase [Patescibacteria group bacterium]|nr:UDP-3-O-(3-hydroxymyristoyl)glucosamine N-acyltransferase [Patescibacteria group bacterium]